MYSECGVMELSKFIADFTPLSHLTLSLSLSSVFFLNIVKHSRDQRTKISACFHLSWVVAMPNSAAMEENWMKTGHVILFSYLLDDLLIGYLFHTINLI